MPDGVKSHKYAIVSGHLRLALLGGAACALFACGGKRDAKSSAPPAKALPKGVVAFQVPEVGDIRDSILRASVVRGRAILEATGDSLPKNVGNSLRCVSCHFSGGTARDAMPWVGVYARFPQVRSRSARLDLIEDRINDCFERSLNGHPLKTDSRAMHDIVAYMAFLSSNVPIGSRIEGQGLPKLAKLPGDTTRGALVFATQCSRCHGVSGQGTAVAPPLWGEKSYNKGAGMSRITMLAEFAHQLMPFDNPRTLTPQQSFDVAAYVNSRSRPEFAARIHDWPNGDIPDDLGYPLPPRAKRPATR